MGTDERNAWMDGDYTPRSCVVSVFAEKSQWVKGTRYVVFTCSSDGRARNDTH